MNRARGLFLFVFCGGAFAITLSGCAATELPKPASAPTAQTAAPPNPPLAAARTPVRIDDNHPPKIGAQFYPAESKALGEEGKCVVRVRVDPDGVVRIAHLVSSTGFERLDAACIDALLNGRFLPATVDEKPVGTWIDLPLVWSLGSGPIAPSNQDRFATPQIQGDYQLKVGPEYYPVTARQLHQEGECVVHVYITTDGTLGKAIVSKSTGFAALDQACLQAIDQAHFVPASQGGVPIATWTDINISWRLPAP
jgi:TonB family protein